MKSKMEFSKLLIDWYSKNGRSYPWRVVKDPYHILLAEIMLQRTRADQVMPVYLSFLEAFPNVYSLNEASEEDIISYFSKLGLMHRAKYVKLLACELVHRYSGKVPCVKKELLSLPAVGAYVSDAVSCFAFNKRVSIIDSNVCRVLARVFGIDAKGEARRDPVFRKMADKILPRSQVKEFNWAIIDLAALICRSKKPLHEACPLKELCCAWKEKDKHPRLT
jgi:A/G-specific adenine glycosylase